MKIENQEVILSIKHTHNKLQKMLINKYHPLVKNLAKLVIRKYYSIPITWEDVYVESLVQLPRIYLNYDLELNDNFNIYLSTHLVYFMRNYCRKWLSKKYVVLNQASEFDEKWQGYSPEIINLNYENWIDKFNEEEKCIITFLIDAGKSYKEITKVTGLSSYKLRQIVKEIKMKIQKFN